jgi:hypothetical protein
MELIAVQPCSNISMEKGLNVAHGYADLRRPPVFECTGQIRPLFSPAERTI